MGKHTGPLYFASLILCFGAEDMQDEDLTEQILSSRGQCYRWVHFLGGSVQMPV